MAYLHYPFTVGPGSMGRGTCILPLDGLRTAPCIVVRRTQLATMLCYYLLLLVVTAAAAEWAAGQVLQGLMWKQPTQLKANQC